MTKAKRRVAGATKAPPAPPHGRLHEAVEHFEQAVRLQPDYESARQNLARARAELIGRR